MKKYNISSKHIVLIITGTALILSLTVGLVGWGLGRFSSPFAGPTEIGYEKGAEPVWDDPDGRASWFMYQRMYPFDKVPDGARRRAFEDVLNRGEGFGPEGAGNTWTPIGPFPTTTAVQNGGFTSGRINAIAVSPANNQLVLIGSATGGIWRSTDGGTSFSPVSDTQADLAVGALAFAPSDPNIVYAGMGDVDQGYFGTGILKSTDAGATWARINADGFPERGNCTAITVDPADSNRVYVAQFNSSDPATNGTFTSGVYLSTDGGVNWLNRLEGQASDIVIHPTNSQIIYAGMRFRTGELPGLYKSTDGATSWTRVYNSPYTTNFASTREFRVAVTPASPDRVYIYFGTAQTTPSEVRLERSDNAGATWTDRGVISNEDGGVDPGQFGYNTYLAVSPTNANTVYVGSRDVFHSTDGGVTFANMNNGFASPYPNGAYTPRSQKFHVDQQSFAFQPGSGATFYCGNDGGIWKTTDGGANFTSLNATLSLTQFIGIGLNPVDPIFSYGGTQDNGTQRRTAGTSWLEFSQADGGKLVINPLDPSVVFHSFQRGILTRSINNASTFNGRISSSGLFGEPATPRIAFYPPIVGNGVDSKIYVGTWRVVRCDNCGEPGVFIGAGGVTPDWTAPGGTFDQTNGGTDVLSAIAVARSDNQVIYTGSRGGRAMVSTNGGVDWTDITAGLPTRSIANITVSRTDPALVYLTVSGYGSPHVFRSTNSGAAWTNINGNLPNIPTSGFLIDPLTPTTLYAGTDIGVFRSTDNGGTWAAFNNGLPPVPVSEFSAQVGGLIQIGTYGRGAYELSRTGGGTPTPTPTASPTNTPTATPTSTPTSTPTPTPGAGFEGDISPRPNGDGQVITGDVVQARRFVSGLDTVNTATNEFQRADGAPRGTLGDGFLSAGDVTQSRRYGSGLDPLTEAGGPTAPPAAPGVIADLFEDIYTYFFGRKTAVGIVDAKAGSSVTLPIEITPTGDETAVSFTLEYDANKLGNPRISLGDAATGDAVLTVNTDQPGRIGILVDSAEVMPGSATPKQLVRITFDVAAEAAGDSPMRLTNSAAAKGASDAAGNDVSMRWLDGYVRILGR